MQIFIDQDSNRFISDPNFKSYINSYDFKRGDKTQVVLKYVTGNQIAEIVDGRQFLFGIKESGKFDSDYIVFASSYSVVDGAYILTPNFNTEELNGLLNHGDDGGANDIASVSLMLEISWSDDDGVSWTSSNVVDVVVFNDVNKGVEGSPAPSQTLIEWLTDLQIETVETAPQPQLIISGTPIPDVTGSLYKIPNSTDADYSSTGSASIPSIGNFVIITWDGTENLHRLQLYTDGVEVATWYGGGNDNTVVTDGYFYANTGASDDAIITVYDVGAVTTNTKFITDGVDLYANIGTVASPIWKRIQLESL